MQTPSVASMMAVMTERNHDPTCYEPSSYIEETQCLDTNVDMHINIVSSLEEERGDDWGYMREALHRLCSPPCKQTRGNIGVEVLLEESQRMEMSCPNKQMRTSASGRLMWTDFTTAVRDWPTPTGAANGRGERWVSAKRGRRSSLNYGQERLTRGK